MQSTLLYKVINNANDAFSLLTHNQSHSTKDHSEKSMIFNQPMFAQNQSNCYLIHSRTTPSSKYCMLNPILQMLTVLHSQEAVLSHRILQMTPNMLKKKHGSSYHDNDDDSSKDKSFGNFKIRSIKHLAASSVLIHSAYGKCWNNHKSVKCWHMVNSSNVILQLILSNSMLTKI